MPTRRTDLSAFAAGLAERLPGAWTSTYQRHAEYKDQFPTTNQLWDSGHVGYVVSTYVLAHDAVLHGPENQRLYVSDRPRFPRQFVVAPLEPDDDDLKPHHFDEVEEPHGIAVANDPARAAADVIRRVLPRYEQALHVLFRYAVDQPEPPHRPAPPQVAQVLTLTMYDDGALGAPYQSVPPDARTTLYDAGFNYHPHQAAFLLSAELGESVHALRVQAVAQQLTAKGIGVNLRHCAPRTSPGLPPAPPQTARAHHR
ncbi:hypothetical protein [Streptomyces sp. H27-C3]|uniref:hypothetical protein n=1 Tax=Streptomyces sp. H27-C3 TaxID=3046305 RepID=UPI0024BB1C4C|nr:hypothetical protein [Streptomyces sp. H27-C3]MDJ0464689.1 hypothetical protein [Streptomyces sp. H27-C3]